MFRRSLVLALMVGLALMTSSDPAAAITDDCAEFVSGGSGNPYFGWLVGTEKVSTTVEFSGSLSSFKTVEGSVSGSRTTSYTVGVYQGTNGGHTRLKCSDYTLI